MRSFIASILLLASTATALPAPQAARPETCVSRSTRASKWIVENFDFHASYIFSTPSHQNSWGYVNFTLANPVLDYKPVCTAASNWLSDFYYGNTIYNCDVPVEGDVASFTYDRAGGALRINQTWNCLEEGGRFVAGGGVVLDLQCEEKNWQNPDWKQGQFYSTRDIKCTPVTVDAPIETLSAVL
ncbi:hypothetical protein HJFPF1_05516 [Paramyrothecium foliicola]|nr:hypothetical protein HJFPF1_05516 [Paramyrothecium foliicola]